MTAGMEIILQPTVRIKLTQGKETVISEIDFPRVVIHSWSVSHQNGVDYACAPIKENGKFKTKTLHRFVMEFPDKHVDHRNGNGLDNRRSNLRLATKAQNAQNSRLKTHKFKGVTFNKQNGKFLARIGVNGKNKSLGHFKTAKEAAIAYNKAAAQIFGEFARLNTIPK